MCRLLEAQPEPPLTSNFVFLFSLILLLPFWVIFQLATHWKISIFQYSYLIPPLTHHHHPVSSPHIDIQKNSNLFFFLPSFVHSFFARDDELFWFSFLFVIVDEISFQHTDSLLSIPPFNIFFLLVDEFCPLPRWQILSRSGTWKNACFVSCRITRSFLFFFQEQRKGCGEMMILDGVASTLDKKKHTKKWLWRIIRPRLPLPAFTSQCLFVALFVLFCFPFFFKYLWDLGLKKYRKVRASKTLSALNGSLLTSLSSDDDANTSFKITVFALMQKNEKGRLHLSLPHHKPTSS